MLLFALMYGAFGVASPFWPRFFEARGVTPEELGLLLAAGTAVRLVTGPLASRLADVLVARRLVLAACTSIAALVSFGLLPTHGFWLLLPVSLCHAAALAPITVLADALASRAATAPRETGSKSFEYGWVRGTGSAVFVIGTLVAGQAVAATGLTSIVLLHAGLLGAAALVVLLAPEPRTDRDAAMPDSSWPAGSFAVLLRIPLFRRMLVIVALVFGSHAVHDAFAVIRWNAAGIGPELASLLWSLSVAAEVVVFFLIGPPLVARAGPAAAAATAASAGVVRWMVMALTTDPWALVLVQPLHGLTFALLHLACMQLLLQTVPPPLAATGQAIYALAAGVATALLTLAAGALYARSNAGAFFVMAALCAAALPLTLGLRTQSR